MPPTVITVIDKGIYLIHFCYNFFFKLLNLIFFPNVYINICSISGLSKTHRPTESVAYVFSMNNYGLVHIGLSKCSVKGVSVRMYLSILQENHRFSESMEFMNIYCNVKEP